MIDFICSRECRGPGYVSGDRYQVITKLWLTTSNYKLRYLGDGLITRVIMRAARAREKESAQFVATCY